MLNIITSSDLETMRERSDTETDSSLTTVTGDVIDIFLNIKKIVLDNLDGKYSKEIEKQDFEKLVISESVLVLAVWLSTVDDKLWEEFYVTILKIDPENIKYGIGCVLHEISNKTNSDVALALSKKLTELAVASAVMSEEFTNTINSSI